MRAKARSVILESRLIEACRRGDRKAISALLIGFWYFVRHFEDVIDERGKEVLGQRGRLRPLFPDADAVLLSIAAEIKRMKLEEGSHAQIWRADAARGTFGPLDGQTVVASGVQELVARARHAPLWLLFLILAGTEYVAEELSRVLSRESPRFVAQFKGGTFYWGEVHLADHDGPSHRQVDEDMAMALLRAAHPNDDNAALLSKMRDGVVAAIELFGSAAADVFELFGLGETAAAIAAD